MTPRTPHRRPRRSFAAIDTTDVATAEENVARARDDVNAARRAVAERRAGASSLHACEFRLAGALDQLRKAKDVATVTAAADHSADRADHATGHGDRADRLQALHEARLADRQDATAATTDGADDDLDRADLDGERVTDAAELMRRLTGGGDDEPEPAA